MMQQTPSQRARDTRRELEGWMAKRVQRGSGPPERAGPGVMSEQDLAAYFRRSHEAIQEDLRDVPRIRLGKIRYYQIRDIASWITQKEMDGGT